MTSDRQPSLFDLPPVPEGDRSTSSPVAPDAVPTVTRPAPPDEDARSHAVDPRHNVVLEASAGTGKTAVLVMRYLNLLRANVDPSNVLAVTFTRKAAAEMRGRIIDALRRAAATSAADRQLWSKLRNRLDDVSIGTIDAFCYGLLREFPLEADLDPGFSMTDETAAARLVEEALDHALREARRIAADDEAVALLLTQLSPFRLRDGLASLLQRRLVARGALERFLGTGRRRVSSAEACAEAVRSAMDVLDRATGGFEGFLRSGPRHHPHFQVLEHDLRRLRVSMTGDPALVRATIDAVRDHFLTDDETPRKRAPYKHAFWESATLVKQHLADIQTLAPDILRVVRQLQRDLNVVLAGGVRTVFAIALREYERVLDEYDVVDFSGALERAVRLLTQMDEFSQSRYRLESRYHHVLVDEFQDTSRLQWQLVSLLVESWGEGFGLVHEAPMPPTVFVVGDRKQSIYRFRDAEVAVLDEAERDVAGLRGEATVRRSISTSFRSVTPLLRFANALFGDVEQLPFRDDGFRYADADRFPISDAGSPGAPQDEGTALGAIVADEAHEGAASTAAEIVRLLRDETVRDPQTGVRRKPRPGDVAILFRSRESHREFELALERVGLPTYVYKGLGFFDADEIKDVSAAMRFLAKPDSNLRAAAFLRSRIVGMSDRGLEALGRELASALLAADPPGRMAELSPHDRDVLSLARTSVADWLARVDALPPAELVDRVLADAAYAFEMRGPRRIQAQENLKKLRALVRRIQNSGYATLGRIADHLDRLSAGDESNAVVDALDAVSLMTIHASKGLEFPIVFLVNLAKGAGGIAPAVRLVVDDGHGEPAVGVSGYQDGVDTLESEREREETKRLLYVAVTRARDKLYFSTWLRNGEVRPGRGSLAEILPSSFRATLAAARQAASVGQTSVDWTSSTGERFAFRVPGRATSNGEDAESAATARAEAVDDARRTQPSLPEPTIVTVSRQPPRGVGRRWSVTELAGSGATGPRTEIGDAADAARALVGRLVHRLVAWGAGRRTVRDDEVREAAATLAAGETPLANARSPTLVDEACASYLRFRELPSVQALSSSGQSTFEVPFALVLSDEHVSDEMAEGGGSGAVLVRGVIDWLVERPDGRLTVAEIKVGRPRPGDERQLSTYVRAVAAMAAEASTVEGVLIYVD
ncbi:MAG: UvrD-helicase domain-containing protein [Vicinamibacterales bacterium]